MVVNGSGVQNRPSLNGKRFANLSNEELLYLAQREAMSDGHTRKQQSKTRTLIKAVPVVDSMMAVSEKSKALGLTGLGTLSTSLAAFATRLSSWALFIGGFEVLDKLINKATKNSDTLSDIDQKHPLARPIAEIGIIGVAYHSIKNHKDQLIKLIPKFVKTRAASLKKTIDSSKVSKKIYEPMLEKFTKTASKYPKLTANAKALRPFLVPALIIGAIAKSAIIDPLSYGKKVANNYDALKMEQDEIKAHIAMNNQKMGGY